MNKPDSDDVSAIESEIGSSSDTDETGQPVAAESLEEKTPPRRSVAASRGRETLNNLVSSLKIDW